MDESIHIISDVALKQPQAAYVAVSKSLQNEWSYMQRVFPDCEELFSPLRQSLMNEFFPALTGNKINDLWLQLYLCAVMMQYEVCAVIV